MVLNVPFKERFRAQLLNGTKTATSRNHRLGVRGDYFSAFGSTFLITNVERMRLRYVAELYWRIEGCDSADDFVATWTRIHPRRGFDPDAWVFVHHFVRVDP